MPGHDDAAALTFTTVQAEQGLADWRMMSQTLETRYATGSFATGLELVSRIGAIADGSTTTRSSTCASARSTPA